MTQASRLFALFEHADSLFTLNADAERRRERLESRLTVRAQLDVFAHARLLVRAGGYARLPQPQQGIAVAQPQAFIRREPLTTRGAPENYG